MPTLRPAPPALRPAPVHNQQPPSAQSGLYPHNAAATMYAQQAVAASWQQQQQSQLQQPPNVSLQPALSRLSQLQQPQRQTLAMPQTASRQEPARNLASYSNSVAPPLLMRPTAVSANAHRPPVQQQTQTQSTSLAQIQEFNIIQGAKDKSSGSGMKLPTMTLLGIQPKPAPVPYVDDPNDCIVVKVDLSKQVKIKSEPISPPPQPEAPVHVIQPDTVALGPSTSATLTTSEPEFLDMPVIQIEPEDCVGLDDSFSSPRGTLSSSLSSIATHTTTTAASTTTSSVTSTTAAITTTSSVTVTTTSETTHATGN